MKIYAWCGRTGECIISWESLDSLWPSKQKVLERIVRAIERVEKHREM